ncbi:hypothetical protein BJ508DRAFT_303402 [Ascobolus immersus RN42]|uniref:Uncharacterized protein n=1 Tax=Ascobolus immersus RN42 TaxID=1160509 RepID=A0A3N4ITT7_ASCIM|nr:hypothetical protein BJ508DRAFT_303402 [Ascobolus immersus RN42]
MTEIIPSSSAISTTNTAFTASTSSASGTPDIIASTASGSTSTTTGSSSANDSNTKVHINKVTLQPGHWLVPFGYSVTLRDEASFDIVIDEVVGNGGTVGHIIPNILMMSCELTSELDEKLESGTLGCSHLIVRISQSYGFEAERDGTEPDSDDEERYPEFEEGLRACGLMAFDD